MGELLRFGEIKVYCKQLKRVIRYWKRQPFVQSNSLALYGFNDKYVIIWGEYDTLFLFSYKACLHVMKSWQ